MTLKTLSPIRLYLALLHYPVADRSGHTIASAVTNLDLHDIARAARTYDAAGFYVVTPLEDQYRLVERIVYHWTVGAGAAYNPKRAEAMSLIRIERTLDGALDDIERREGRSAAVILTSARRQQADIDFDGLRVLLKDAPVLLVFGTAWGLAEELLSRDDYPVLTPLQGSVGYNHLAVRSAVSIMLDRLVAHEL